MYGVHLVLVAAPPLQAAGTGMQLRLKVIIRNSCLDSREGGNVSSSSGIASNLIDYAVGTRIIASNPTGSRP